MFGRRKADKQLLDAESILTLVRIDQRRLVQHRLNSLKLDEMLDDLYHECVHKRHYRDMESLERRLNTQEEKV